MMSMNTNVHNYTINLLKTLIIYGIKLKSENRQRHCDYLQMLVLSNRQPECKRKNALNKYGGGQTFLIINVI